MPLENQRCGRHLNKRSENTECMKRMDRGGSWYLTCVVDCLVSTQSES
jgi:hypothetical protein